MKPRRVTKRRSGWTKPLEGRSSGLTIQAIERIREFRQRVFGRRMLGTSVAELIREGRGERGDPSDD